MLPPSNPPQDPFDTASVWCEEGPPTVTPISHFQRPPLAASNVSKYLVSLYSVQCTEIQCVFAEFEYHLIPLHRLNECCTPHTHVRSAVSDSVTPRKAAHQALCPCGFSRQEYRSGLPFPTPGDLHQEADRLQLTSCHPDLKPMTF